MADFDKVIKALEHCSTDEPCYKDKYINCPYTPRLKDNADYNCARALAKDALELLKEQKEENERIKRIAKEISAVAITATTTVT